MPATLTAPHLYTRISERRGYTVKAGAKTRARLTRGIDVRRPLPIITMDECAMCGANSGHFPNCPFYK